MDPKLVGASGDRSKLNPRSLTIRYTLGRQGCPLSLRRFSDGVIHHLPRPVGPVTDEGEIDTAFVMRRRAFNHGQVGLFHPPLLKLTRQGAVGFEVLSDHNDARRCQIQPMDNHGVGMLDQNASVKTVPVCFEAARNAQ